MFNHINEALIFIENQRHKRTTKEYKDILLSLDINLKQKNMIHITGTNGKGSTVNYIRSILNAHGYKVGTFTSPYIIKHNDRIRVDDVPISDEDLLFYINKHYDTIQKYDLSMFEIDTLIMLDYFNHTDLDYRIIECGIGGRRDKTNVIEPYVSVITNIGYDHMEQLGNTKEDILKDKTGIIKAGQHFFTSETDGVMLHYMQGVCDIKNVRMHVVPEYMITRYPFHFNFKSMSITLENQGVYQVNNARLALFVTDFLIKLDDKKTIRAVEEAMWQGRFETVEYKGKKIEIDGAHNLPGIESLIRTIKLKKEEPIIIFSPLKDKLVAEMLELLVDQGYTVYLTTFNDERAIDLSVLKPIDDVKVIPSFEEALRLACIKGNEIIVTGSLHFISYVRKYFEKMKEEN